MNLIFPSEKRKIMIGEMVKLDSPTLIVNPSLNQEIINSSPLKIIGYKSFKLFKDNTRDYEVFIIDPELLYPLSPLYREKYRELYEFIRRSKFKKISVVSGCMNKKNLKKFLKSLKSYSSLKIEVRENYGYKISVFFTSKKLEFITRDLAGNLQTRRTLILSKDIYQSLLIKNYLKDVSCLVLKDVDFDARRAVLSKFKVEESFLVVPYKFRFLVKNMNFSNVVYIRVPRTLSEFIHDTLSITSDNYTIVVSHKDEGVLVRRLDRYPRLREEYLEWLNFLGFKGDKREYLSCYLMSKRPKYLKYNKNNVEVLDEKERIICGSFQGRYVEFEEGIKSLIGVNDRFLWRHFGSLRGLEKDKVVDIVNELVNRGFLGFRYFYNGKVVKKIY